MKQRDSYITQEDTTFSNIITMTSLLPWLMTTTTTTTTINVVCVLLLLICSSQHLVMATTTTSLQGGSATHEQGMHDTLNVQPPTAGGGSNTNTYTHTRRRRRRLTRDRVLTSETIPENVLDKIPTDKIQEFKVTAGLKQDYELELVMIDSATNTITFPTTGIVIPLHRQKKSGDEGDDEAETDDHGYVPYNVWSTSSSDGTPPMCYSGGEQVSCYNNDGDDDLDYLDTSVYIKYDYDNQVRIQLNYDEHKNIDSIILRPLLLLGGSDGDDEEDEDDVDDGEEEGDESSTHSISKNPWTFKSHLYGSTTTTTTTSGSSNTESSPPPPPTPKSQILQVIHGLEDYVSEEDDDQDEDDEIVDGEIHYYNNNMKVIENNVSKHTYDEKQKEKTKKKKEERDEDPNKNKVFAYITDQAKDELNYYNQFKLQLLDDTNAPPIGGHGRRNLHQMVEEYEIDNDGSLVGGSSISRSEMVGGGGSSSFSGANSNNFRLVADSKNNNNNNTTKVIQDMVTTTAMDDATSSSSSNKSRYRVRRHLEEYTCNLPIREVQMAVVVDKSFCNAFGGTTNGAKARVESILADVSYEYLMDGLCFIVTLKHFEDYCTGTDPYANCLKGDYDCGSTANCLRDFWETHRTNAKRDVTHLFTGKPVSTVDNTIGCAWLHSCPKTNSLSYGVVHVTYSSEVDAQKYVVAHELGHNLGSLHDDPNSPISKLFIMYPSAIHGTDKRFSAQSRVAMLDSSRNQCIEPYVQVTPTTPAPVVATPAPTSSVNPTSPTISASPSTSPTQDPTSSPTTSPSRRPSSLYTGSPSESPSPGPTVPPSDTPTSKPTPSPTEKPTGVPSEQPTDLPTSSPSDIPTGKPSTPPSKQPTDVPTVTPTMSPTPLPSTSPTKEPTSSPSMNPSANPSKSPSSAPSDFPTSSPTTSPTSRPTLAPTASPSRHPTRNPSIFPTRFPTRLPSSSPTRTVSPSVSPTASPTKSPSERPTTSPTKEPTRKPTNSPSVYPTKSPSSTPTKYPTLSPSANPTTEPTKSPSGEPTLTPSMSPTGNPTTSSSPTDSTGPSAPPSEVPTGTPTISPSGSPTSPTESPAPTANPSSTPSHNPTVSSRPTIPYGDDILGEHPNGSASTGPPPSNPPILVRAKPDTPTTKSTSSKPPVENHQNSQPSAQPISTSTTINPTVTRTKTPSSTPTIESDTKTPGTTSGPTSTTSENKNTATPNASPPSSNADNTTVETPSSSSSSSQTSDSSSANPTIDSPPSHSQYPTSTSTPTTTTTTPSPSTSLKPSTTTNQGQGSAASEPTIPPEVAGLSSSDGTSSNQTVKSMSSVWMTVGGLIFMVSLLLLS